MEPGDSRVTVTPRPVARTGTPVEFLHRWRVTRIRSKTPTPEFFKCTAKLGAISNMFLANRSLGELFPNQKVNQCVEVLGG